MQRSSTTKQKMGTETDLFLKKYEKKWTKEEESLYSQNESNISKNCMNCSFYEIRYLRVWYLNFKQTKIIESYSKDLEKAHRLLKFYLVLTLCFLLESIYLLWILLS